VAWAAWTAILGWALLFDWQADLLAPEGARLAKLGVALLAVCAVLASPWLGGRTLPSVAGLIGIASLAVSVVLYAGAGGDTDPDTALGFSEPAALLWLLLLVPVRARRWWVLWAVPPLLWTAVVLRPVAVGAEELTVTVALLLAMGSTAVAGVGAAWRLVRADRRRQAQALRHEQRTEFARDLHDFVAHHVTGIVVQAQGTLAIAERRPELVGPSLRRIEQAGAEALASMRHMVGMLRDPGERERGPALTPLAGIADVRTLVDGFAAVGGPRARLEMEGTFDDLPLQVSTTAHRVVMEALTNVRKHSHRSTEVLVQAARAANGGLTVRVSDDGRARGVRHHSGSGFGLKGLTERVALIGGHVHAGPRPGGGWSVEATLPSAPARARAVS
jgi:signal transduction histidine kinase